MSETALGPLAVYRARPTLRLDGEADPRVSELLIGMRMHEREGGLASLELRFSNVASLPGGEAELAFEDETRLRLGALIAVHGGDENAPEEIFRGRISALEAEFPAQDPPELVVLAEDALMGARMARRSAVYRQLSLADLAREVAGNLGLTPQIDGFADDLGTWVQLNESDLAFLRRLLRRHDGDVQVVGEELQVSPRAEVRRGELELVLYSQLREARVCVDLAEQLSEITVSGWDPLRGERIRASSRGSGASPGRGRDGAGLLADTLGERTEHLDRLGVFEQAEAEALAEAAFEQRARRFVQVEGTAEGNPRLRVGTHVALGGLSRRFDNTYYVIEACHRFDVNEGYRTWFRAESAFLGEV